MDICPGGVLARTMAEATPDQAGEAAGVAAGVSAVKGAVEVDVTLVGDPHRLAETADMQVPHSVLPSEGALGTSRSQIFLRAALCMGIDCAGRLQANPVDNRGANL